MSRRPPEEVHKYMSRISSKNTKPEMIVRKGLWKRGFRYRLNHKRLPGHPDLASHGAWHRVTLLSTAM